MTVESIELAQTGADWKPILHPLQGVTAYKHVEKENKQRIPQKRPVNMSRVGLAAKLVHKSWKNDTKEVGKSKRMTELFIQDVVDLYGVLENISARLEYMTGEDNE